MPHPAAHLLLLVSLLATAMPAAAEDGLARWETTVGEFRAFVEATGYVTESERSEGPVRCRPGDPTVTWRHPGAPADDTHPVVCVTPGDAQAYVAWRSQVEGRVVRLPRAEELLAALRPKGRPFWGEQSTELCRYANLADRPRPHAPEAPHCGDAYPGLAPVGRFAPDAAGRFDLAGNAAELTATCNAGDQATSAASSLAGCRVWKVLGGSYESLPEEIDPAHPIARETGHLQWDDANVLTGFRVFREPVR